MRASEVFRETKETKIIVSLNIDGSGTCEASTPVGFLNHMLETLAKHGRFDLKVEAEGDVHVSYHHTVEDCGMVIGQAFREALGDMKGIQRFGSIVVPMDEALVLCALDFSGRGLFYFEDKNLRGKITDFDFELIWEFFKGFALESKSTVHMKVLEGKILHHVAEACFKAFAVSLRNAVQVVGAEVPSTKGAL
jgi:imidazoleglycerol-phosphate dehydratase